MRRCWILFLFLFAWAPAASAAVPSGNLLVNPGAEADTEATTGTTSSEDDIDVDGWDETGEFTAVRYDTCCGFPTPAMSNSYGGGANFFSGGNVDISTGTQVADLSGAAAEIDLGHVEVTMSARIGGFDWHEDYAFVTATFLDGSGAALATIQIGPVTRADRNDTTALLPRMATTLLPVGTRSIRVVQTMDRSNPTTNDGYVDNVSLTVADQLCQAPAAIVDSPGPHTIEGTEGDDLICAGDGDDVVRGLGGNDRIIGGDGDDTLDGGDGEDKLEGGPGDDLLNARDGVADELVCGDGQDGGDADPIDKLAADCETLDASAAPPEIAERAVRMSRKGVVRIRVTCPPGLTSACDGALVIRPARRARRKARGSRRSRPRAIGRARMSIASGTSKDVKVKLSHNGRRRVLRQRRVRCKVSTRTTGTDGAVVKTVRNVVLKAPRLDR